MSAERPPGRPQRGVVRSIARTLVWPLRRFFDPRFAGVLQEINEAKQLMIADAAAVNETAMYTGRYLDTLLALVEEHGRSLDAMRIELEELNRRLSSNPELARPADEIDRT